MMAARAIIITASQARPWPRPSAPFVRRRFVNERCRPGAAVGLTRSLPIGPRGARLGPIGAALVRASAQTLDSIGAQIGPSQIKIQISPQQRHSAESQRVPRGRYCKFA